MKSYEIALVRLKIKIKNKKLKTSSFSPQLNPFFLLPLPQLNSHCKFASLHPFLTHETGLPPNMFDNLVLGTLSFIF
jgi:hypothetical protein